MDLQVVMSRVPPEVLMGSSDEEPSSLVRERIRFAWRLSLDRNGGISNAALPGDRLASSCGLDARARSSLTDLAAHRHLSARSVHRLLRVARTVADLEERAAVGTADILAAASLRGDLAADGTPR
jgi:magnesium chelatase family protein